MLNAQIKKKQTFLILRNMSAFATSQTKRVNFGGIPLLGVEGREVCDWTICTAQSPSSQTV